MGSLWWGAQDGAFFDYETISKNRKIKYPMYPHDYVRNLPVKSQKAMAVKPKQPGEIRILSGDIALMSSKKHNNDASAIFINAMQPTKAGIFMNNIIYGDVAEGLRTEDQALMIRKLYDEFECDYIVLDTNGSNARRRGDMPDEARKKSGMLRCKSEWKVVCKKTATRNA